MNEQRIRDLARGHQTVEARLAAKPFERRRPTAEWHEPYDRNINALWNDLQTAAKDIDRLYNDAVGEPAIYVATQAETITAQFLDRTAGFALALDRRARHMESRVWQRNVTTTVPVGVDVSEDSLTLRLDGREYSARDLIVQLLERAHG